MAHVTVAADSDIWHRVLRRILRGNPRCSVILLLAALECTN